MNNPTACNNAQYDYLDQPNGFFSDKSKLSENEERYANSFNAGPFCFERQEEGGEAGSNNQKPSHQTYLGRHVTGGLTTKWAIEIQLKDLELWCVLIFFSRIKGVANFTTYLWFPHKGARTLTDLIRFHKVQFIMLYMILRSEETE